MSKRSYYDYLGYKCNQYLFTPLIIITFVYFFFFEFNLGKLIFINFFGEGIKNLINNFENHIDPKDPTNNCLDVAIITAPEKRTQKTIDKLKTVAGRVLNK
jgi:hypothetical protein